VTGGAEEASSAEGQRAISDLAVVLSNYPLARLGCPSPQRPSRVMAIATSRAGRILKVVGSDEQRSHGGRLVPNHAETVASSVLHQDIAGRKQHLRAIVNLDC
jgi:hypothetical protein